MSDPFAPKSVLIYLDRNASSACRLCLLRNQPSEMMVWLKVLPSCRLTPYCPACYEELRGLALDDVKLPELANIPDFYKNGMIVKFPPFLIKEHSALVYFYPTDEIDLGALRQRRKRERG